ncbi:MAG TPA: DoxX family protein, partial [Oceanipulchritudo sp.]|nr:DoxX family protein [Oceanipulchritudo sp.]
MTDSISIILQLIIGLGILNVWFLRAGKSTPYRGADAGTLKDEFAAYGLPEWAFYLIGGLKVG